ncbi:MAG: type II toxin-antitoxin system Phd/YefM family antitoxin [Verrucomicrobia bacterium]|nr:type II toxin-antitoxin system Phd/YefM family antitoxin [Verrucomicrobiota bacterium]
MKLISIRDFRGKSASVWRELHRWGELVITSNGKPIAIVTPTSEVELENSLASLRQAKAIRALAEMHEESVRQGTDQLTDEDVECEITAVRSKRRCKASA